MSDRELEQMAEPSECPQCGATTGLAEICQPMGNMMLANCRQKFIAYACFTCKTMWGGELGTNENIAEADHE
jgi:hypothetical protein